MRIRTSHADWELLDGPAPPAHEPPLKIANRREEMRRVVRRLRASLSCHAESAARLGLTLGLEDLQAVVHALRAKADGLSPAPYLTCSCERRCYLRRVVYEDWLGEPSNILYVTRQSPGIVRLQAMPAEFWKECLEALLRWAQQAQGEENPWQPL